MRTSYFFIFPVLLLMISSCEKTQEDEQPINDLLLNCWIDSYEENASIENQLFRPCDFKVFEASRFRFSFELETEDKCKYLALSPIDAHTIVEGTWSMDASNDEITIYNMDGDIHLKFNIVETNEDLLKIKFH